MITDRAALIAAASAGLVALVAVGAPLKLGLMLAGLAGIVAGLAAER